MDMIFFRQRLKPMHLASVGFLMPTQVSEGACIQDRGSQAQVLSLSPDYGRQLHMDVSQVILLRFP